MEIKIRKWQIGDEENLSSNADNIEISNFMSDGFPSPFDFDAAKIFIQSTLKTSDNHYFAITVDDEPVGGIGISVQSDIHRHNAELGYWLGESFWNKGITTVAIGLILKYSFDLPDITRIFAKPFGNNIASHKVLYKLGFKLEARFKNTIVKNNEILDELIFAILKRDYLRESRLIHQ